MKGSNKILLAAMSWWKRRRPAQWTLEQHLEQPTVNMRGIEEFELAEAIAESLRERK